MSLGVRLDALDVSLFDSVETQTTLEDRRSLLALHAACRREYRIFSWLEIGSYLGGSLQALVRDPRCASISSIDPRPWVSPDERFSLSGYPENSTQRMLELLSGIPGANPQVIRTYDASTEQLDPEAIDPPQVCFIDGEHTDEACQRDAEFCRRAMRGSGLIAFHDVGIVYRGVGAFIERLAADGVQYRTAYLPDSVFAVELSESKLLEDPLVVYRQLTAGSGVLWLLQNNDRYRAFLQARRARVLRRLRVIPDEY